MNYTQNFINENRPAIVKGFIVGYKEEVVPHNGEDLDITTILVVSKTKDKKGNFRDQYFEINAYNGELTSSSKNLSRIKKFLEDGESIRGSFAVWINGDEFEVKANPQDKKKNPDMVIKHSVRLSLQEILEVSFTDVVYTYEGEDKEVTKVTKTINSEKTKREALSDIFAGK